MADLSEADAQAVRDLILDGQKIEAIKRCREATGMDLKAAKEYVETWEKQLREEGNAATPRAALSMPGVSEDVARDMTQAIFEGRKIDAIKLHRDATRLGLKESKEFIDELTRQLREECPERFTASAKSGCGAVFLLGGLLGLAGWLVA